MSTKQESKTTVSHLPEHGPIDENGREILLQVKNVDITFGKGDDAVKAVKNASFDIYKGETFSLVGESGSGKTTIGRAVIRVNPCSAGEILYKGVKISGKIPHSLDREVIRNIQMVFQDPAASLNERATVDYIVSEGLYNFHLYENEADRVKKVENMINEVGLLPEHLTRYPHEFSGGQRQRIGLARAMVMEPELVVADTKVVQCRVYTTKGEYWGPVNEEYAAYFGDHRPARIVVTVPELHFGCLVEIEAVAEL